MLTWNDMAIYAGTLPPEFRDTPVRVCVYGAFLDADLRECQDDTDFVMPDGTPYLEVE